MVLLIVVILVLAVLVVALLARVVSKSRAGQDARSSWAAAGVLVGLLLPLIYLFISKRRRNRSG